MSDPVFVIHGVGNRDQATFAARVARLQETLSNDVSMVPVFWGDLGAHEALVAQTVPHIAGLVPTLGELVVEDNLVRANNANYDEQVDVVLAGASSAWSGSGNAPVRSANESADVAPEVDEAVRDEWHNLNWLVAVSDPAILESVGRILLDPLAEPTEGAESAVTRGDGSAVRDLIPDVGGWIRRRLHEVDDLVGLVIRDTAGRVNESLRTKLGPNVTEFFGDVLVYQRHRSEIHDRVRHVVEEQRLDGLGTAKRPLRLVGHSLGGVIAFDLATAADSPLWTGPLVTFGSQAPFFHVADPREGLAPYELGQSVKLPPSLGSWLNLWESLDVVAFVAANVFVLNDGTPPKDIEVKHLASSGVWTHSVYWETDELKAALNTTFQ